MKKYVVVLAFIVSTFVMTAEAGTDFCTGTLTETARDYAALSVEDRVAVRERAEQMFINADFRSVAEREWTWITLIMHKVDGGDPFSVRATISTCINYMEQEQ